MLSPTRKLTRIRVLMLLSQVLLMCFMVYWLRSEYFSEQEVLKKDLTAQLQHSQDAIFDSLVTVSILNPAIKDMSGGKAMEISRVTLSDTIRDIRINGPMPSLPLKHGPGRIISQENTLTLHHNSGTDPALTRGVRLMISGANNLPVEMAQNLTHTDTFLLKKVFQANIQKAGYDLGTQWLPKSSESPRHRFLLVSPGTPGYTMEVLFYGRYLVRKIIPQFLFSLVLLSLTAVAFFITFKSLRSQTHLAAIRNEFISNISHELKTPVTTVKVALEALTEAEVLDNPVTTREYVRMASLEMSRLELLVNQTLQSSLLDDGRILLQTEHIDLRVLVDELLHSLHPRFVQQAAEIQMNVSGDDFVISADRLLLQGVVVNILDNALKYAGPTPSIKIHISETTRELLLSISDNGPGIPAAYTSRIFDKFFRVPRGNEHSIKGYGLGLSYAAQVMKMHGGNISMRPSSEGGCDFLLRFMRNNT